MNLEGAAEVLDQESGREYILNIQEAGKHLEGKNGKEELWRLMANHQTYFSKASMLSDCIVGVLVVAPRMVLQENELPKPVKRHQLQITVPYYLGKDELVFPVREEDQLFIEKMVHKIEREGEGTTEQFFCRFLESMLFHDMEQLQEIEAVCYDMEEKLTGKKPHLEPTEDILRYRKRLLVRNFYYQQLADLCDILVSNDQDFLMEKTVSSIAELGKRADRLYDYSQMLREYMVQIRELYQQQIDIQQNNTMRMLTMVTTMFFPLTLVTGWYGMNFVNMPELKTPHGYGVVVLVCILIIVAELVFFKKKKFL